MNAGAVAKRVHRAKRPTSSRRLSAAAARKTCGRREKAPDLNFKQLDKMATEALRKRGLYADPMRKKSMFGLGVFPFEGGGCDGGF